MSNQPELASRLKRIRERAGCSTYAVAEATGINPSHLSAIENGRAKNPTIHLLAKLAAFYDLSISDLVGDPKVARGMSAAANHLAVQFDQRLSPSAQKALAKIADELEALETAQAEAR